MNPIKPQNKAPAPEVPGTGVPQSYKNNANSSANVMWRTKIKGQKTLAGNIPLHMSLKTFDKPEDVPHEEIHHKVKELGIERPNPQNLSFEPTIFKSPRSGQTYYMLKIHGTDPSYKKFNEHFAGRGITHDNGFMGHVTINKELYDQIQKEGMKPEDIQFSPLMIEHGANNPTHLFTDKQSHKDAEDDITPKQLNPVPVKKSEQEEGEFLSKPFVSEAQRRWGHTAAGKEALGGEAGVHEWDEATKGKKLPEKVSKAEDPSSSKANDEDAKPLMNRIEDKYFVPRTNFEKLISVLKEKLPAGDIDTEFRHNTNQTIYLDNNELKCFRDAMESKKPRLKVRIRRYAPNEGNWENVAYTELKVKKEDGMSDKIRIRIPAEIIKSITNGEPIMGNDHLFDLNKDISKEELTKRIDRFNSMVKDNNLKKRVIVMYERRAYSGKEIRITVDDRLKCAAFSPIPEDIKKDLESGEYKKFVKPLRKFNDDDYLIVEVKHTKECPEWVDELLKECEAKSVKFSKYCSAVYSNVFPNKEIKKPLSLLDFSEEMHKSEILEKSAFKKLGTAAAMIGALAGSPNIAHAPHQPAQQEQPGYSSNKMLNAISQVESSGGKNVNHAAIPGKMHHGERAIGKWGITPVIARETIKMDPNLKRNHPRAMNLHGQDMEHYLQDNPGLERGIAERHLRRLEHHFGQDPAKIGVAWLDGIVGANKKFKQGLDPKKHWHGAKVLEAYSKGK